MIRAKLILIVYKYVGWCGVEAKSAKKNIDHQAAGQPWSAVYLRTN